MRIIGGRLKGRVLKSPGSDQVRPTADRLRETIFNILIHAYGNPIERARVIDLFAGTGAMGLEALSRGAGFVLFVEQAAAACAILHANIQMLGLEHAARVLRCDARKLGIAPEGEKYSLIFLDPPYGRGLAPPALAALGEGGWLAENALLVIEDSASAMVRLPDGFALAETRRFGPAQIMLACVERDLNPATRTKIDSSIP
jgi:16S rRNA (guanine966-N2)-methyltransferase